MQCALEAIDITMDYITQEALSQEHTVSLGNGEFGPSEANTVIDNFNKLSERDKQDLLNFLRSL
jgi:hypothetical protein